MVVFVPVEVNAAISIDEAALAYCSARDILARLSEAGLLEHKAGAPLPRGMLTCSEAVMLSLNIVSLAIARFPQLACDDFAQGIAALSQASGRVQ